MNKNKNQEQVLNKSTPPQPQQIKCKFHEKVDGVYVMIPSQGQAFIVCENCKRDSKYKKFNSFVLNDAFNDPLEAYRKTNFSDCPLQYFSQYYHSQNFHLTEKDIDKQFDSFIEHVVNVIEEVKEKVKAQFTEFSRFLKEREYDLQQPRNEIKYEHNLFREKLSQLKDGDQKQFHALQSFCEKIKKKVGKADFEKDPIVELTKKLRGEQTLFYNINILEDTIKQIDLLMKNLSNNYIGTNSFTKSQIATNNFILEVFKKIKQEGSQKELIASTELYYEKVNDQCFEDVQEKTQKIEGGASIILMETNNNQKIGLYYNGQFKQKSLLFNLNKQIILPAQKEAQLLLPQQNSSEYDSCLIQMGQDLVIPGNLSNCKSKLGDVFDVRGLGIVDCQEFLTNSLEFEILAFEIFEIKDPAVTNKQNKLPQSVPHGQQVPNFFPGPNIPFQSNPNAVRQTVNPPFQTQK